MEQGYPVQSRLSPICAAPPLFGIRLLEPGGGTGQILLKRAYFASSGKIRGAKGRLIPPLDVCAPSAYNAPMHKEFATIRRITGPAS